MRIINCFLIFESPPSNRLVGRIDGIPIAIDFDPENDERAVLSIPGSKLEPAELTLEWECFVGTVNRSRVALARSPDCENRWLLASVSDAGPDDDPDGEILDSLKFSTFDLVRGALNPDDPMGSDTNRLHAVARLNARAEADRSLADKIQGLPPRDPTTFLF